uniref:CS domain-containing protein n=1 Tax=Heterosigma akashiwo TaxID=2829 RepID=A0A6V1N9P1_HETAK
MLDQWMLGGFITVAALCLATFFLLSSKKKKKSMKTAQNKKPQASTSSQKQNAQRPEPRRISLSSDSSVESASSSSDDDADSNATPFARSKSKGDQGYYYAHHNTAADGLSPEDFQMGTPKPLNRKVDPPAGEAGPAPPQAAGTAAPAPLGPALRGRPIRQYSWEDAGDTIKILFMPDGWNWTEVDGDNDIKSSFTDRSFTVQIDTPVYGTHYLKIDKLRGAISAVTLVKRKKRLDIILKKAEAGEWKGLRK